MQMVPLSDDHFDRLARLLDLEADAEREQAARSTDDGEGRALTGLVLRDEDVGLGGHLLLTFARRDSTQSLPPTRLQPGSPVLLRCPNELEKYNIYVKNLIFIILNTDHSSRNLNQNIVIF